jgi:hypothetical protein
MVHVKQPPRVICIGCTSFLAATLLAVMIITMATYHARPRNTNHVRWVPMPAVMGENVVATGEVMTLVPRNPASLAGGALEAFAVHLLLRKNARYPDWDVDSVASMEAGAPDHTTATESITCIELCRATQSAAEVAAQTTEAYVNATTTSPFWVAQSPAHCVVLGGEAAAFAISNSTVAGACAGVPNEPPDVAAACADPRDNRTARDDGLVPAPLGGVSCWFRWSYSFGYTFHLAEVLPGDAKDHVKSTVPVTPNHRIKHIHIPNQDYSWLRTDAGVTAAVVFHLRGASRPAVVPISWTPNGATA